jgi:hypothetical protein
MAGLFGIGGGAVIVPVLYEVFGALGVPKDVRMQACIGTSFAVIIPTTLRSWFTHRSRNPGLDEVVRKWTLPAIAGVATGVAIATVAPAAVFKAAFAAIAAVIAVKLLFSRDSWQIADDLPRGPAQLPFSLRDRTGGVADGGERGLDRKHDHDALRQADSHGGRDRRGAWRADRDRRRHRVHGGRRAAPESDAAAQRRFTYRSSASP